MRLSLDLMAAGLFAALVGCSRAPAGTSACEEISVDRVPPCGTPDEYSATPRQQQDLDGCTRYRGNILFSDFNNEALTPIRNLAVVDGELSLFRNHEIENLEALARLRKVGGRFSIRLDDSAGRFTSLAGAECLTEVGSLRIEYTPLRSLEGLSALRVVHGDVAIQHNPDLPRRDVSAFLERIQVGGAVHLEANGP